MTHYDNHVLDIFSRMLPGCFRGANEGDAVVAHRLWRLGDRGEYLWIDVNY